MFTLIFLTTIWKCTVMLHSQSTKSEVLRMHRFAKMRTSFVMIQLHFVQTFLSTKILSMATLVECYLNQFITSH